MQVADDALVVRNILSFEYKILSQFVKPPSDTLLRYMRTNYNKLLKKRLALGNKSPEYYYLLNIKRNPLLK
jgi:hypothetical protein